MNLSKLSRASRFAIAFGATMGVGHVIFQASTRNLGPVVGLVVGLSAISAISVGLFLLLESAAKKQNKLEAAEHMSPERMASESRSQQ